MSEIEEDLVEIVADLGDDAQTVLRLLVDIYRLGQRNGDKAGYERGYTDGARKAKSKLLEQLGSIAIGAPDYDEAGTVALTTPIMELHGLDRRVALTLQREYCKVNENVPVGDPERIIPGTLADVLNAPADGLHGLRGFGRGAAKRLYDYLKSIGYERKDLLELRY